ncbi:1,4-beta-D-glucan glucohydrolase [Vibrio sp. 10N.286.48.B8]|uniref:glycoside hydrolase family 3 protein n=1 Tax=Vibrio sp. 10N.286.48.B8 TaxID=2056189 RepID=UPI000D331CA8|nr:glycoside hydrolase family 3 protein [Vibrio sp. 10N.286.48.B8]PTO98376.1 1,4-beta-D-glucan glucohydrolase [Vibrio sp. 10N.286.48.B8]
MTIKNSLPYFKDWPTIESAIKKDPIIEDKIIEILQQMTLEEKVGQMIQPNLREVTPEEVYEYKLGSILNGGGAWPNENKHASAQDWADCADTFWEATEKMFEGRGFRIPFVWATDAVHGHNNVFGSTVFPHNIGLGCARDPELIHSIGEVTAREVVATGLDWTFAPTVATPRDYRWGRVYEGYSEDPAVTFEYAAKMVQGLQGDAEQLKSEERVLSNVKHFVGDGGTRTGIDRGVNGYSEELLINIHAMGYFSGLEAGAQVVMSSFNSWEDNANYDHSPEQGEEYNLKIHGSKYLLTDVLKEKMGFDGLIVTDWNGHAEVSKCTDTDAVYAINAGNDVLMVPVREHWKGVIKSTLSAVNSGVISMARIDDAVTRILRVKMRAGLWNKPRPSLRQFAGKQAQLGAQSHRKIARESVRKSLVLLKNNNDILPLSRDQKIILTGSAANDLQKQSGGWNLTWQGDENTLDDFPGATTVKMALEAELGTENVTFDLDLSSDIKAGDVAVVVFGEDPYAEMMGDIKAWQSLEFSKLKRSYRSDCEKVAKLNKQGVKVISIFFSGRPLYLNEEIAQSEAFVAAFLPGSEGMGITDVLIRDENDNIRYDFVGQLSYSWPNKKRSVTVNRIPQHIPNYVCPENEQDPNGEHAPLFEYGYGLNYTDRKQTRDLDNIELDIDVVNQTETATESKHLYGVRSNIGDYNLKISDLGHWIGSEVSRNNPMAIEAINTEPYNYEQQQDAIKVNFNEQFGATYIQVGDGSVEDFSQYRNGSITFEIKVKEAPTEPVKLSLQKWTKNEEPIGVASVDITELLIESDDFIKVSVPCQAFIDQGVDLRYLDTPFMLYTKGKLNVVLANISWNA